MVKLEYSSNGGASWTQIAGAESLDFNAGCYDWDTTGLPASDQYRVRAVFVDDPTVVDGSDGNFRIAQDTTPPVIVHTPLADTVNLAGPYTVCATVADDLAVDDVTLHWSKNGGAFTSVPMAPSDSPHEYCADIPGPSVIGDVYCYHIEAADASTAHNTSRSPAAGENCFNVIDCKPPAPSDPGPADGAAGVSVEADLSWTCEQPSNGVPARVRNALESIIERSGIRNGPLTVYSDGSEDGGEEAGPMVYASADEIASVRTAAELGIATSSMLDVAVCGAETTTSNGTDIQTKLLGTGQFNSVSIIDLTVVTPTLAELQAFDAVQVHSDSSYLDSAALGDVMADYVDAGGGVVCMMFEINASMTSRMMQGRWASGGYYGVPRSGTISGTSSHLGTIYDPSNPILDGVSAFDGGTTSYRPSSLSIAVDWTRVADWSDGHPLVVIRDFGTARRADLCFFPVSSSARSDLWQASTDGALLMANSLAYVSGAPSAVRYDVYMGATSDSMTRIATDLHLPTFDPGLLRTHKTYYWKVVAKNGCGETEGPIWSFATEPTVITKPADGGQVALKEAVVTAAFPDVFYVETPTRESGIRVRKPSHGMAVSWLANITGVVRTNSNGERYIDDPDVTVLPYDLVINPLELTNQALGAADWLYDPVTKAGQRGITGSVGLNNIGLLVSTCGKVTESGRTWFYIDDGSNVRDGTGIAGVYCEAQPGVAVPPAGAFVKVTGISSCELYRTALVNVLLVRDQNDINDLDAPLPPPPPFVTSLTSADIRPRDRDER